LILVFALPIVAELSYGLFYSLNALQLNPQVVVPLGKLRLQNCYVLYERNFRYIIW
jgi:hypothetical protein